MGLFDHVRVTRDVVVRELLLLGGLRALGHDVGWHLLVDDVDRVDFALLDALVEAVLTDEEVARAR